MKLEQFEKELQLLDKDLSIRPNNPPKRVVEMYPDTANLASIILRGSEVCTIPNFDIYDEKSGNYGVDLRQDGRFVAHRTRPEALQIVKQVLERIKNDKDYRDQFFGTGDYSDANLNKRDEPVVEVVENVIANAEEVTNDMIESPK